MTCTIAFRRLHAPCIVVPREQATSMSCDTGCFGLKRGDVESNQLPPCNDMLRKLSLRANYPSAVWRRRLQRWPDIPSPVGSGWCTEDGTLVIDWMGDQPAPQAVLEVLSCQCSRSCKLPSCSCIVSGMKCTDMCRPQDCTNKPADDNDAEDSDW